MSVKKIWFNLYVTPLLEQFKFKDYGNKEKFYNKLSELSPDIEIGTLKKAIEQKRLEDKFFKPVQILLLDTDFYKQFFDISLIHRIYASGSERESLKNYKLLKLVIHKNDRFWGRWLNLFELKYEIKLDGIEKNKVIEILESDNFNDLSEISKKLKYEKTFKLINQVFNLAFKLAKTSLAISKKEKFNNSRIEIKIEDYEKSKFYHDMKMLNLYQDGTFILLNFKGHFKEQNSEDQKSILEKGGEFFQKNSLKIGESSTFKIWYLFYKFLHVQREMEFELIKKEFEQALIFVTKSEEILNEIEEIHNGEQNFIILKLKYQRRYINLVKNYLEIYNFKINIEDPFKEYDESEVVEYEQENKQNSFSKAINWLNSIFNKHI